MSEAQLELTWPRTATEELSAGVADLLREVVALGGAVGWLQPPSRAESDEWLAGVLADISSGAGALCVARVDGEVRAMGTWRRGAAPVFSHTATVEKIMAHPRSRGLGLGPAVTSALVADATKAGIETLTLGVRGNNHLAIAMYRELGFEEWGRCPNLIAVGDDRFDDVRMYLELGREPHVRPRGSSAQGPGSSPAPA